MKALTPLMIMTTVLLFAGCATRLQTPAGIPEISVSDYKQAVRDRTEKIEVYDGLYNKLTVQATWIDTQLTEYTLSHKARISQWNEPQYRDQRSDEVSTNADSTRFFVSFYAPERKHSELGGSKSIWKIYLDVGGQRYEGRATKIKLLLSEVEELYPYHNRWSTPYYVSFPVATSLVENKPATLIFTSAVGSAEIYFNTGSN